MSFIFYPSVDFHSHFSDLRRNITLWFISCLESPWTIINTAIHKILIRVLIIIKLLEVVTKQMNSYVLLSIRFPWGVYHQFMIQLIIAPFTWFIHVCSDEKVTTLWSLDQHENKVLYFLLNLQVPFAILGVLHKVLLELYEILLSKVPILLVIIVRCEFVEHLL